MLINTSHFGFVEGGGYLQNSKQKSMATNGKQHFLPIGFFCFVLFISWQRQYQEDRKTKANKKKLMKKQIKMHN